MTQPFISKSIGYTSCGTPRHPHDIKRYDLLIGIRDRPCSACGATIKAGDPYILAWPPGGKGQKPHCAWCCKFKDVEIHGSRNIDFRQQPPPTPGLNSP